MSSSTGLLTSSHQLKQRYAIRGRIGQGGMGAVYKAEDTLFHNRLVAVKEMSQSGLSAQEVSDAVKAFKSEAHMLAGLDHRSLPKIHDYFTDAGRWYLVMDFIEGETLEDYMEKKGGKLSVQETLEIGIQLSTVLVYLHDRQPAIIFRDLKPSNIMRTRDARIFLIDFGIARHFKVGQTKDTAAFGSAGYAAPEQYGKAQTGPYSDVYSLGATLHQCITGDNPAHMPFKFAPIKPRVQAVSGDFETFILQMVSIDVDKRASNMAAVKKELERLSRQSAGSGSSLAPHQPVATSSVQQWLMTGDEHLKAGRSTEALAAYEQAIRLDPNFALAYYNKGVALRALKRYEEALSAFEQAIRLDPNEANAYRNKGIALSALKRYEEAFSAFEQAIRLDPNEANVYYNKGNTLGALQRYEEALSAFEQATRLDPNFVNVYYNKGNALYELQRYEEALSAYEQVIRLDPNYTQAHENKAIALEQLGRPTETSLGQTKEQWLMTGNEHLRAGRSTEALAAYEQAIRLDPNFTLAYYNKGILLNELHRYEEALSAFEQAIRLDPNDANTYHDKGIALNELHRNEEALSSYDQAIRLDPNYTLAYYNKGNALRALNHYTEALSAYEQAIRLDPNFATAYISKGYVLDELQRSPEALAAYEQAIRLNPNDVMAYNNKGYALLNLKRYTEALSVFEQAIRLDPNYTFAHNNKGSALLNLKRYTEAISAYEQAIRLDPNFVMAYENKGVALRQLGRETEARQADEKARQLRAGQRFQQKWSF